MVEALERQLAGDLGMVGDQRLVGHLGDDERVLEALGVGEDEAAVRPRARGAGLVEALLPEVERLARCDAPADPVDHPRAGPAEARAPGNSKKVMSAPGLPSSSA